jgi:hypothetical protein
MMTNKGHLTGPEIVAVERIVKQRGRSPQLIKELATKFSVEESLMEWVTEPTARPEQIIFESTPSPMKGNNTTMGTRTVAQLSHQEVRDISEAFRTKGTTRNVIEGVGRRFNLAEATAEAFARASTTAPPRTVTESGSLTETPSQGMSAHELRHRRLAEDLAERVNRVEAVGLPNAQTQDLEAYAAAMFGS